MPTSFKMKNFATATWIGTGRHGQGTVISQSKLVNHLPYSFDSRFNQMPGTNPEELLAAAHACDFCMKLSFVLEEAGYKAENMETTAYITLDNGLISGSHLVVKADIKGMNEEALINCIREAESRCLISQALKINISFEIANYDITP